MTRNSTFVRIWILTFAQSSSIDRKICDFHWLLTWRNNGSISLWQSQVVAMVSHPNYGNRRHHLYRTCVVLAWHGSHWGVGGISGGKAGWNSKAFLLGDHAWDYLLLFGEAAHFPNFLAPWTWALPIHVWAQERTIYIYGPLMLTQISSYSFCVKNDHCVMRVSWHSFGHF